MNHFPMSNTMLDNSEKATQAAKEAVERAVQAARLELTSEREKLLTSLLTHACEVLISIVSGLGGSNGLTMCNPVLQAWWADHLAKPDYQDKLKRQAALAKLTPEEKTLLGLDSVKAK